MTGNKNPHPSSFLLHPFFLRLGFGILWLFSLVLAFFLLLLFTYAIGNIPEWFGAQGGAVDWWAWGLRVPIALIFAYLTFWLLFHPRRSLHYTQLAVYHLSRKRLFKGKFQAEVAEVAEELEILEEGLSELEANSPILPAIPHAPFKPITRRRFLAEASLVGAFTLDAFFVEPFAIDVRRLEVKLPNLPPAFEGLTIAQLSDIHIDPYTSEEAISRMVTQTKALKPDLIFVTGDFISRGTYYFEQAARALGALSEGPRLGLYGVSGNHDHWADGPDLGRLAPLLKKSGLPLLRNSATRLELNGDSLWLLGTDDSSTHNDDLAKTLRAAGFATSEAARRDERAKILLSHNPEFTRQAALAGADLLLSGHTHGGQVYFPVLEDWLVSPLYPQYRGYYRVGERTQVYVNNGAGVVGPPMRFLSHPEILLLRLVKA